MGIPENLKRYREEIGLSQSELATKASVSQQLISQLERGENLTTKKLPQIARALGKAIHEIDPSFAPVDNRSTAGQAELAAIADVLKDYPDLWELLLERARVLELRAQAKEAPQTPRPAAE